MNLVERVLKTIRNYEMLKPNDTVLIAVSGGQDSMFLLQAMNYLKTKLKLKKLVVCNLDHGIRGKESAEDSLFVKTRAEDLNLGFIHKKIDLSKKRSKGSSMEEAARKERYEFFNEAALSAGANVAATGHTLDDQAETILMRIIKGASLKGIVGISPVREERGIRIIRPLFELEKGEIEKYLDERGLEYRIDSTNKEPLYFRNVVRKEILPFLEKYNPRLKRVLCSLAEHLREDFEFIRESKEALRHKPREADGVLEIKLKDLITQPKALQKEVLRDALDKIGGEVKRLNFRHWKEAEQLIARKRKGSSLDLPGDIRITRTAASILFQKRLCP
ncbi:MAG: tRNA lysidine(34) synthetase TilS [Omnitrophica bacterium RIFCSPLOWO2_02_FULL_45_16]|nr:MAG: tRNA lysidine(34) synthetase TilS [Omnitrophica bacterium RIFCSPHIGHO2_02_FULL_46_20]OGW99957.1 MAG: tRNA lysidine(34) synthetase TilS [Omnitrophica bacterium RIFCSPLOWO2_02_FULL_45_16]